MSKELKRPLEYALHERIKYLRKNRGLTQAELAKATGITQSSLAHFEGGTISPTVKTLMALGRALDLSPAIFFTNDDIVVVDLKKIEKKYKTIRELPDTLYRGLSSVYLLAKKLGFG